MAESAVIKVICANRGAMDYAELVDIVSGLLHLKGALELVAGNTDSFSIATQNGTRRVVARTKARLCKARDCPGRDCGGLHLCKLYLYGDCRFGRGRRGCRFCHDMNSTHNVKVLRDHNLQELDWRELCTLLLQNDNTLLPQVCFSYNRGHGAYGTCPDQESCRRLHVCDRYLRGGCGPAEQCPRSHDLFEPHPLKTLQERQVPNELIGSLLSVYQNAQALKDGARGQSQASAGNANANRNGPEKTEICPYFVKGSCKQEDRCWKHHSSMPYKWEQRCGTAWSALPDSEEIERDFCNPDNEYSSGVPPVCFDTMTRGPAQVRRLSTVSSVIQPTFILTTEWAWYWQDEHGNWIQYASLEGQHRLSSVSSVDLEKRYQEESSAVVKYSTGAQPYTLSFQDMIQTNLRFGTKMLVRRRPVFVSSVDAQRSRSRNRLSHNFKALPGNWDKSKTPETGFKIVSLQDSSDEHKRILQLFMRTVRGQRILSVERVQNRALWEVFQWQRDQMRMISVTAETNVNERLLFHGTDSVHIDAICKQNFDWRICGTHGTAYGKGSYFARDAKYSHCYTGSSGIRTMFLCRVLVGSYTKGDPSYLRPPSKDGGNSVFYDSCVDDVRDPSVFVVFEKHQVYPEYLITYELLSTVTTVNVSSVWQASAPAPSASGFRSSVTVISNAAQSLTPLSTSFVISNAAQSPTPLNTSFMISNAAQSLTPLNTSFMISNAAQSLTPLSTSFVISNAAQSPTPLSTSFVISNAAQSPTPLSTSFVISNAAQSPTPLNTSMISNAAQSPTPLSTSMISNPAQSPTPLSTSMISNPAQASTPRATSVSSFDPLQSDIIAYFKGHDGHHQTLSSWSLNRPLFSNSSSLTNMSSCSSSTSLTTSRPTNPQSQTSTTSSRSHHAGSQNPPSPVTPQAGSASAMATPSSHSGSASPSSQSSHAAHSSVSQQRRRNRATDKECVLL